MAQENITITLPVSGEKAVIKPFISHKVARTIQSVIIGGQKLDPENKNFATEVNITGADGIKMNEELVKGLLLELGEHNSINSPLEPFIDDLDEEDYAAILNVASKVYEDHVAKTEKKELPAGNKNTSRA